MDIVARVPSLDLQYLHFVSVPLDSGVTEDVEELAPQLQMSRGVGERLPPDLADHLWGWGRGRGGGGGGGTGGRGQGQDPLVLRFLTILCWQFLSMTCTDHRGVGGAKETLSLY